MRDEHIVYRSKFEAEADAFWFEAVVNGFAWCFSHPFISLAVIAGIVGFFYWKRKRQGLQKEFGVVS